METHEWGDIKRNTLNGYVSLFLAWHYPLSIIIIISMHSRDVDESQTWKAANGKLLSHKTERQNGQEGAEEKIDRGRETRLERWGEKSRLLPWERDGHSSVVMWLLSPLLLLSFVPPFSAIRSCLLCRPRSLQIGLIVLTTFLPCTTHRPYYLMQKLKG